MYSVISFLGSNVSPILKSESGVESSLYRKFLWTLIHVKSFGQMCIFDELNSSLVSVLSDLPSMRGYVFNRRRSIRKHLMALVAKLKKEWVFLIDNKQVARYKNELNGTVGEYLSKVRKVWVKSSKQRWRKGLRYTMINRPDYDGPRSEKLTNLPAKLQLGVKNFHENPKIEKPLVVIRTSDTCRDQMQMVARKRVVAADLEKAIRNARAAEIVSDENDSEFEPSLSIRYHSDRPY